MPQYAVVQGMLKCNTFSFLHGFNVILLNDDYTTMEFVLQILETLFQKSPAEAFRIMMHVHRNGRGLAGVYTWEVAETKADQVAALAADAGYPLRATIEEA